MTPKKICLTLWATDADDDLLHDLIGRWRHLSRHAAALAAMRAGVAVLLQHPELVPKHVDPPKAGLVQLRSIH